jgi:peptide/nickel transport system permease protein
VLRFILRRGVAAFFTIVAISMITFFIIQLPPGDFLTSYATNYSQAGDYISQEQIQALRDDYGLDQPVYVQYVKWVAGMLRGDFGRSLEWQQPVAVLIGDRLGLTIGIGIASVLFVWLLAIPIGVYSARHQYSAGDYGVTLFGFIGLAIPNFMLALVLMWIAFSVFGMDVGALVSPQYRDAPWSIGKILDVLSHLWIPILIVGMEGLAGLVRTMRANTLDEINQPYVETARAKGLSESRLTWKYPVRVALNPFVSTVGYALPQLVGGVVIVAYVLNLPTVGPLLLKALTGQDMYLAGAIVLIISILTVIGTLISDILLAVLDPRIRLE